MATPFTFVPTGGMPVTLVDEYGVPVSLGGGLEVGSAITGGTDTRVLFNDGGVLGDNSAFTFNKTTGLLSSTKLALGGATIGTHALAVTGTSAFSGATTWGSATGVAVSALDANTLSLTGVAVRSSADTLSNLWVRLGIGVGSAVNSPDAYLLRVAAGVWKVAGASGTGPGAIVTNPTAVASLPAAATAGNGARAFVTDASATTFASTVTGGGSNKVPVYSDGTNWLIG